MSARECPHGVPTDTCPTCSLAPALEASIEIVRQRDRYKAERDELLEACESAREWLAGWASAEGYIEKLDAAIQKARGAS